MEATLLQRGSAWRRCRQALALARGVDWHDVPVYPSYSRYSMGAAGQAFFSQLELLLAIGPRAQLYVKIHLLQVLVDEGLAENAARLGSIFRKELQALGCPLIKEVGGLAPATPPSRCRVQGRGASTIEAVLAVPARRQ